MKRLIALLPVFAMIACSSAAQEGSAEATSSVTAALVADPPAGTYKQCEENEFNSGIANSTDWCSAMTNGATGSTGGGTGFFGTSVQLCGDGTAVGCFPNCAGQLPLSCCAGDGSTMVCGFLVGGNGAPITGITGVSSTETGGTITTGSGSFTWTGMGTGGGCGLGATTAVEVLPAPRVITE